MGLFKKKQPIDSWVSDLQDLVASDPEQFTSIEQHDDKTYVVRLQGDYEVWVTFSGTDLYFIVGLSNIGKMAESFGISVEDAYREMTQYVTTCSLGIDGEDNLRFASVLFGSRYTPESLRDMMYRWVFETMDFTDAFGTMIDKYKGGSQ